MKLSARRWVGVGSVAVALAACGGGGDDTAEPVPTIFADDEEPADDPTTASTDTRPTTTTAPVADRLPPLADDAAGAVRTGDGLALAIVGTDGENWTVIDRCGMEAAVPAADAVLVGPQHVVLDPGNGGDDRGTVGAGGVEEAELNLDIAMRTAALLRVDGIEVLMTRTADTAMTPRARAALVRAVRPRAAVSLHHGGEQGRPADSPGTETFHQIDDPESRRLAGLVHEEVTAALGAFDEEWRAPEEPGVKALLNQRGADFHTVLREAGGVPTVFVELAMLSGVGEAALLATEEGRQAEAAALARAVVRFLVTDEQGRGFIEPTERVRAAESARSECP